MLTEAAVTFLALFTLLYALLGGVCFGSGVVAMITGEENRITISGAVGPVWEVSHVWLVLAGLILFFGFPSAWSTITFHLAVPLIIILTAILLRATAFIYMDGFSQDKNQAVYKWVFRISTILSPVFLGVLAGAISMGMINPQATGFQEIFVKPWFNLFSFSVGLFVLVLFAFMAAVYMIGQASTHIEVNAFSSAARSLNVIAIATGVFIFTSAELYGLNLFEMFVGSDFAILMVVIATLLVPVLWLALRTEKIWFSRLLAAGQVTCVISAWFWVQMPVVVKRAEPAGDLTYYNTAAPDELLQTLLMVIAVGVILITPMYVFMMRSYKGGMFYREKKKKNG